MAGGHDVPARTAWSGATAHRMLTQRVVQPIYITQLDGHPWLALVAWDSAVRGQEDQKGSGHHGFLKAHLGRRARETLRACIPNTAFLIPYMQEGEKEGAQGESGSRVRGSKTAGVQGSKWVGGERGGKEVCRNTVLSLLIPLLPFTSLPHAYQSCLAINLWHLPSFHIRCS